MSNFGGRLGQPKKATFSVNIIQQVVDFLFWNRLYNTLWKSLFSFTYLQIREKKYDFHN
jgi:hypothetical protein